jgi:hypothetical protein
MTCPRTPLKTLIIASTALLLGAPFAQAGYDGPSNIVMQECGVLAKQFDHDQAAHKTDKNYKQALALGTEGKTLCSSSGTMQSAGVKDLQSAMKLIGVKPNI